jgi:DNA-binding response OmpR family regulator
MVNSKKVILVVEDEKPLLEAIKSKLLISNFEVITARTVEQAKQYLLDVKRVDAIWLDHYLLGKENGLDFIAWCKEVNIIDLNNVPIYVVSNTVSADKLGTYMSLGAKKYFVKSNHRLDEIIHEISESLLSKN